MTRPTVRRTFACPSCAAEEGFTTKVRLGDYVEVENDRNRCNSCRYTLTQEEEQEMCDEAWESAPEDYADERADALYERARDRTL